MSPKTQKNTKTIIVVPAVGGADKVACDAVDAVKSAAFADDDGFCIFSAFWVT